MTPFQSISAKRLNRLTLVFFIVILTCSLFLKFLDSYFTTELTPNGIVSFEFAKDLSIAIEMMNSWSTTGKIAAGISTGFDYLYLVSYSMLIALLIHKLNEKLWKEKPFYKVGIVLIYSTFLAALFDATENIGLLQLLLGNEIQFWVSIAYYFALAKFVLLFFSLVYILLNGMKLLVNLTKPAIG